MVKKLLHGKRQISLMQLLMMIAVICGLVVGFFLIESYKTRWQRAQRNTVTVCESRNAQATRLKALERADVQLQQTLVRIEETNPFIHQSLRKARVDAYTKKMRTDEEYLAVPQPDCKSLRP